jgi:hypothetical protein
MKDPSNLQAVNAAYHFINFGKDMQYLYAVLALLFTLIQLREALSLLQ